MRQLYFDWRAEMEKKAADGRLVIVDCAFESARRSFTDYCGLDETVSLACMLWCEHAYECEKNQDEN